MFIFFCSLEELSTFIKNTDAGLMKPLEEGDYDGLVERMGYLCGVKRRQQATDEMFEPLKQTIELLKTYQQEMKEEVHVQLQVCTRLLLELIVDIFSSPGQGSSELMPSLVVCHN
jgi:hypothetical protein